MGLFNKAPLIVHRRQNMSCTISKLLESLDEKLKQAEDGLYEIQKMVDTCKEDITEIKTVLENMKNRNKI